MDLIKITPDNERVKSIMRMVSLLEERIQTEDRNRMAALIISDYYEIVKELITALLLINGYKTLSHKDLIEYIEKNHSDFSTHEISIMNDLRVLRNRVVYEGFLVEASYIDRNEESFKKIIQKLKKLIKGKI